MFLIEDISLNLASFENYNQVVKIDNRMENWNLLSFAEEFWMTFTISDTIEKFREPRETT